jgi:hypothetical protein
MGTRTVRLDDDTEASLDEIRRSTGLSISEVLKRGIEAFRKEIAEKASPTPFEIYAQLELGPGGYSAGPSTKVRETVREILRRKHRR